mmetsp:Transcript_9267/g.22011  ORF Transcript_9267/g.22011 Transcript_9267/m.22011 type:complete len:254 (+) Transcript_9267:331-1092(+)
MMLLWVVMAVAVRRWQSLLAVAVGRRVCLVLIRRRGSLTVTAARLMRGGLRRHVRSGRARPGHETGCMDSCVCSCITTVRCGAASQTGSLGRVGRAPRLAEGALLSTRQPWAAVRGAPATIVVVVAWPLVVAAVEGRPARVRAVGVGGLLLVRGPLMWYLLVGGLRRRRRRRRRSPPTNRYHISGPRTNNSPPTPTARTRAGRPSTAATTSGHATTTTMVAGAPRTAAHGWRVDSRAPSARRGALPTRPKLPV